jgi:hypothetical protein
MAQGGCGRANALKVAAASFRQSFRPHSPEKRDGNNERDEIDEISEGWENGNFNLAGVLIDFHHALIFADFR